MTQSVRSIRTTAFGVVAALAGCIGASLGGEGVVLKHDDGTMESKQSTTGGGHAVLFECPSDGPWYLDKVELFGARYGYDRAPDEDFVIYVTDASMENVCKVAKPYDLFEKGKEKWTRVDLPAIRVPQGFYVCFVFNPTQTKGVYVGIDENVKKSHSRNAVPGSHMEPVKGNADWMVRAHLKQTAEGEVLHLLSKEEREQKRQAEIAEREARLLKGAQSAILKHDDGEMDKHHSYGGSTAQTVLFEAPAGEWYVYGISFYGSQYGGQHDFDAVNGDVYLLDEGLRVLSRTSFPYSLLTYNKAWIEVPTLATKVTGKFYVAIHAHSEKYKGIYVGYDEDIEVSHSSLASVSRKQFKLKSPPNKVEWMIRVKVAGSPVYYD
ncbi:hypothetical protein ACFL5Q_02800 [Planctomycetota bacterium]